MGRSNIKFLINLLFDGRYTLSSSDSVLETMLDFIPFIIQREKMKRLNFLTAHAQQLFRQVLFRCAIFLLLETLDLWSFCGRWDHHCVDTSCSCKKKKHQNRGFWRLPRALMNKGKVKASEIWHGLTWLNLCYLSLLHNKFTLKVQLWNYKHVNPGWSRWAVEKGNPENKRKLIYLSIQCSHIVFIQH